MPTILAIDDKADNLVVLSALLKNLIPGCLVIKALSGQEGIEKARTETIDTILLDIQMPGMDGFETCRVLREVEEARRTPIIMLTAINTDSKSRVRALEQGADAFLSKPFDNSELTAQVRAMLRIKENENLLLAEKRSLEEKILEKTRELRTSREKYEDLYENAPEMFLSIEPMSAKILQCNNSWVKKTGYSRESVFGRCLFDFCHPDSLDEAREALALFTDKGEVKEAEFQLLKKNGDRAYVSLSVSSVRDEGGKIIFGRSIFHDITVRKEMEMDTKRLIKFVDSKNLELKHIIYAASHDLRSPLVNINGFSRILKDRLVELKSIFESPLLPEELRAASENLIKSSIPEVMNYIFSGVVKMNKLLDALLEISRIGNQTVLFEKLNINEIVDRQADSLAFQLGKGGIKFLREELPDLKGDEGLIGRMFTNLIENAIKYASPERPCVIRVTGRGESDKCIYTIEDNGIGIDSKNQQRVFKLFYREKPAGPVPGEGIGLSIVKRILDIHNGTISLESEEGSWTRLSISLPINPENQGRFLMGDVFE